jgi:DNA-binding SARP family transcriptional activator
VARLIAARPLLPGLEGPWVARRRQRLAELRLRAVSCMAEIRLAKADAAGAAREAELALELDPVRESGWRLLMRAHAAAGDVAAALAAYERCRTALADRLGVAPSLETRTLHRELLLAAGG